MDTLLYDTMVVELLAIGLGIVIFGLIAYKIVSFAISLAIKVGLILTILTVIYYVLFELGYVPDISTFL
jgi:hypothetical protein